MPASDTAAAAIYQGSSAIASALVGIQMRNMEALVAAQKAALEGFGTLAKQQQDIISAAMRNAAAAPAASSDPQTAMIRPIDAVKSAILDKTANSNTLSELAAQSAAGVAGILQARMLAALDELKAAMLEAMPKP